MQEFFCYGNSIPEVYHCALIGLYENGEIVPCPDYNTNQKEISMTMHILNPTTEPMISALSYMGPRELQKYIMEMVDGIMDFEVQNKKWKYTYHDRMVNYNIGEMTPKFFNQIDFIIDELKRNPDSRRAVIDLRDNKKDPFSEDPACCQHIQLFIRNGSLHMKVLFRSNDACKAAFANMFALVNLQSNIANRLGIPIGSYTHRANSFHCYEKDYKLLEGYVNRIKNGKNKITSYINPDTVYFYNGDWDEQMESEIDSILKEVEELKNRD